MSRKSFQLKPSYSVQTDRQTDKDMTKLTAAFRNLSNAPKKAEISKTTIPYPLV